jgi:hypothetical protein
MNFKHLQICCIPAFSVAFLKEQTTGISKPALSCSLQPISGQPAFRHYQTGDVHSQNWFLSSFGHFVAGIK